MILPIRQQTPYHAFQVLETQEGLVAELALAEAAYGGAGVC